MVARCFGCSIILVIILISGKLFIAQSRAEPPESSITETADPKVYNICYNPQNCTEPFENSSNYDILEMIANEIKEHKYENVWININTTRMSLSGNVSFSNLSSLTINGKNSTSNIFCEASTNASAGIVLSDVHSITLNNLKLTGCGSAVKNYILKHDFSSALTLVRCSDVKINRLNITQSKGTGLTVLDHLGGRVSVVSSTFKENSMPQGCIRESTSESSFLGGGGVYVYLDHTQESSYSPIMFQFRNCTFENNKARNKYFSLLFINDIQKGYYGGEGGGVYLSIGRTHGISDVSVSFLDCTFADNRALVGGGLSVKVYGKRKFGNKTANNISIVITDSWFKDNGGYGGCRDDPCSTNECTQFGGGVYFSWSKLIEDCHYQLTRVHFFNNRAQYGGGVYYYSDRNSRRSVSTKNSVLFDNCSFDHNRAHVGSAIDMTPSIFHKLSSEYSIVPTFKNCHFLENCVFSTTNRSKQYTWSTQGLGTIRTSHQNINFQGHNIFERNWGTALYVVNAIVNFQKSSASFVNNVGLQGGAIALIGPATMIVGPHDYVFQNNSAYYQGGAIYILLNDHFNIEVSQRCFIQYANDSGDIEIDDDIDRTYSDFYNEWKANITFRDNHVLRGTAGCTIFATSLYSCQVINNGTKDQPEYVILHPKEALTSRGIKIDNNGNCTHQIATDGVKFHADPLSKPLVIIPGEDYNHNITIADDLDQIVNVPFWVAIRDPKTNELLHDVKPSATYIEDEIQLKGNPNQTEHALLRLHTLSPRQIFIEANVTLAECPPGFVLSNKSKCVCNDKAPVGIFKCDLEKFHSHLLPGYWAGLIRGFDGLVTSTCPFCEYSKKFNTSKSEFDIALPQNYSELNETICGDTRTGIVCGKCQSNYTVHFHSPSFKCKEKKPVGCKLGWLFYILSEIVPVTVVFIIVLVFNISFTSGSISGFILFSQLLVTLDINASGIIKFSDPVKHRLSEGTSGYLMLYGVFNLNFFDSDHLSFCIMTNASALDMIAFKYVTILYTLLLILSVIWVMNKCGGRCCGKFCRITTVRSSVVHGLSSFLVMCYTRCVQVSMNLLNPVHFNVQQGSGSNPGTRVWLNGDIEYFHKEHLRYALPALFCLLTIGAPPPALLVCYPLLNKVKAFFGCDDTDDNCTCLFCHKLSVRYLKPLLDSFQSCFKDNMRFFAGLYFLYRWLILLVYTVTQSYSVYYITIVGGLVGILALHAICQPYVKRAHNIIDTLLLANLIIICCLSFYNFHRNHYLRGVEHSTTTAAAVLQLVLIYLPLTVLCVYILMIVCKTIKKYKTVVFSASDKIVPRRANRLREFIRTISNESEDNDSDEVELSHDQLMDEDVWFDENTRKSDYFKAGGDTEMILLKT